MRDSILLGLTAAGVAVELPLLLGIVEGGRALEWVLAAVSRSQLLWFMAEILTMLSNRKRRAIHDFLAGTVVVRLRRRRG
jgi:uncharacterized RDD family membrane protein YckC